MYKRRDVTFVAALAAAVVAWGCDRPTPVSPQASRPNFWAGGEKCVPTKFTGGGRIDPPNPDPDPADEPGGGSTMTGKVTFGFNVFLGTDADGNCIVTKGQIQVVHHPSQTSWHVSIHNGVDEYSGEPVSAFTYNDGKCVRVGGDAGMRARVDGQSGYEQTIMTACDKGEPGSQQPGVSDSGPDSFRWQTADHGDTDQTLLTGGNIQAH